MLKWNALILKKFIGSSKPSGLEIVYKKNLENVSRKINDFDVVVHLPQTISKTTNSKKIQALYKNAYFHASKTNKVKFHPIVKITFTLPNLKTDYTTDSELIQKINAEGITVINSETGFQISLSALEIYENFDIEDVKISTFFKSIESKEIDFQKVKNESNLDIQSNKTNITSQTTTSPIL